MVCIVCKEESRARILLPCLHTICDNCLREFLGHNNCPNFIFSCPMCDFKVQIPKEGINAFKRCEQNDFTHTLFKTSDNNVSHVIRYGEDCLKTHDISKASTDKSDGVASDVINDNGENTLSVGLENGTINSPSLGQKRQNVFNLKCDSDHSISSSLSETFCPHVLSCLSDMDFYCACCDIALCDDCVTNKHSDHKCTKILQTVKNKKEYINELLAQVQLKASSFTSCLEQLKKFCHHLKETKEQLRVQIKNRAESLCQMIEQRRDILLSELDGMCDENMNKYVEHENRLNHKLGMCDDACKFANQMLENGSNLEFFHLQNEMTSRLLNLIHQAQNATEQLEMINLRIEIPEKGREESHLEKLFGGFLQGNVNCTNSPLVASFDIELNWPMSLEVTKDQDYVIIGKDGAFESNGKILFYNRHAHLETSHRMTDNQLPCDVVCLRDGTILISDNQGQISKYSSKGAVLATWRNRFKGIGRMARSGQTDFLVTSSEEHCVLKYDSEGQLQAKIPAHNCSVQLQEPHYVATNENDDIIISDYKLNTIFMFNANGDFVLQYGSNIDSVDASVNCLFALCCDPFDNMLVADFPNDQVSLVSMSGHFLGHLLTRENGISCPNFVSLDHEGHLFVGQYGGEIKVFRYLSYVKCV